jgi:hypothetical protein
VLPFEIASIILLAAMVGAIYLARELAKEELTSSLPATPALAQSPESDRHAV